MDENTRYNVATIRRLLSAAFTTDTLRRFCDERAEFHALTVEFSPQHGLSEMVDRMIVFCRTRWLWDELLREVKADNPRQYERFEDRLGLDTPPEEVVREGKVCLEQANAARERGDTAGAIACYDRAIALLPSGSEKAAAYRKRGGVQRDRGNSAGAMADYDQAIALDPKNGSAFRVRGNAKYRQKNRSGAIADYDQAIALNPKDAVAYYNRGNARRALKDYAAAIADYDQAIALDPGFIKAHDQRAIAQKSLGQSG